MGMQYPRHQVPLEIEFRVNLLMWVLGTESSLPVLTAEPPPLAQN